MNAFYEIHATTKIDHVICPKHKDYMVELNNGFLGEQLWWCYKCECPYYLRPTKVKEFNREAVDAQLKQKEPKQ